MEISNDSSSSSPTQHTASAGSTSQPAELPSCAQSTTSTANDVFSGSANRKRRMPAHPLEPPAKNSKPWLDEGDVLIIYSKHKEPLPPSVAIVVRLHAIPQAIANAACESLDKEIGRKREEGALEAGKLSSVMLEWTTRTREVIDIFGTAFKVSADLAPIQSLGGYPRGTLKWAGPIVYCDVLPEPNSLRYPSSALGYGIIGIIALGTLVLPQIGDCESATVESGSVAYFRDSSPVVYRACKGRGIMFYIS